MTTTHGPLFNLDQDLRDDALRLVLDNAGDSWRSRAVALICEVLAGQEVLAEDWRLLCEQHGIRPHHPNAWGGLTAALMKDGTITDTGRLAHSRDPRSHARRQPVWKVRA
jgi:hypothetical protein